MSSGHFSAGNSIAAAAETHWAATPPMEALGEPRVDSKDCFSGVVASSGRVSQRWVRAG